MRNSKQDTLNPDRDQVIILEKYELNQWSQLLGVTQQDLIDAVFKAGSDAKAVKEFLRTHNN